MSLWNLTGACQIQEQLETSKGKYRGFETTLDLAVWRRSAKCIEALNNRGTCLLNGFETGKSRTPIRQQTECPLTNRLSYRGSNLKFWTQQPVPMMSEHSAHLTSLPIGFFTWLWRFTCLLLLISMLWHRQAIFESKGDKLSSSAECRTRTWEVTDTAKQKTTKRNVPTVFISLYMYCTFDLPHVSVQIQSHCIILVKKRCKVPIDIHLVNIMLKRWLIAIKPVYFLHELVITVLTIYVKCIACIKFIFNMLYNTQTWQYSALNLSKTISRSNRRGWQGYKKYSVWLAPDSKIHGVNWGPPGSCRPQMGPMLAPWTLLSGAVQAPASRKLCLKILLD